MWTARWRFWSSTTTVRRIPVHLVLSELTPDGCVCTSPLSPCPICCTLFFVFSGILLGLGHIYVHTFFFFYELWWNHFFLFHESWLGRTATSTYFYRKKKSPRECWSVFHAPFCGRRKESCRKKKRVTVRYDGNSKQFYTEVVHSSCARGLLLESNLKIMITECICSYDRTSSLVVTWTWCQKVPQAFRRGRLIVFYHPLPRPDWPRNHSIFHTKILIAELSERYVSLGTLTLLRYDTAPNKKLSTIVGHHVSLTFISDTSSSIFRFLSAATYVWYE